MFCLLKKEREKKKASITTITKLFSPRVFIQYLDGQFSNVIVNHKKNFFSILLKILKTKESEREKERKKERKKNFFLD